MFQFIPVVAVLVGGLCFGLSQAFPSIFASSHIIEFQFQGVLALISFVPLLLIIDKLSLTKQYLYALGLFLVGHSIMLIWIFFAMNVNGASGPIKSIFFWQCAAFIISATCAFAYPLASFLKNQLHLPKWITFPIALCAMDWFRSHFPFGGFPIGVVGHAFATIPVLAQAAAIVGMYGLSFVGGFLGATFAEAIQRYKERQFLAPACAFVLMLGCLLIYGQYALSKKSVVTAERLSIGLLQGDIPVEVKKKQEQGSEEVLAAYMPLHEDAFRKKVDFIVWPETSFPYIVKRDATFLARFPNPGVTTILGAVADGERINAQASYTYDTAFVVRANGEIADAYDKVHLIPVAEYLPWIFHAIQSGSLTHVDGFYPGKRVRPVNVPLANGKIYKAGIFVCYDGLYQDVTRELAKKGADFLLQLSSEAWYFASAAPYQFLNMYRLRAIETGLTVVRAANNGISGWIDPLGNIHDSSKMSERTLVVADVPVAANKTLYVILGDIVPIACCVIVIVALLEAVIASQRKRRSAKRSLSNPKQVQDGIAIS